MKMTDAQIDAQIDRALSGPKGKALLSAAASVRADHRTFDQYCSDRLTKECKFCGHRYVYPCDAKKRKKCANVRKAPASASKWKPKPDDNEVSCEEGVAALARKGTPKRRA